MVDRFDKVIERRNTNSVKWDGISRTFGRDDLLPMWVADSDWPAPEPVIAAIKERVEHGVFGYTVPGDDLDQVVVDWVKRRYNWAIDAQYLVYTPGVVPAINVALKALTGPGGNVVVQPPVYYPFFATVARSGANLIENQLILEDNQYKIDFEDLEEKLNEIIKKEQKGTNCSQMTEGDSKLNKEQLANLLILCSPHNPVGRVWKKEELKKLADLCLKYNIFIVSDEIHGDLIYSGKKHIPIASISKDIAMNTITMIAPSKTFNLAGLGAAVTIIPNKNLRELFLKAMEGFVVSGNLIGYTAMKAAYSKGDQWLDKQLEYLEENRDFAIEYINSFIPDIDVIKPEGTYLLWLNFRGLGLPTSELERFMIEEARVGLDAGAWFGKSGEGFMRLNMACPRTLLVEGLKRIKTAVDNLSKG